MKKWNGYEKGKDKERKSGQRNLSNDEKENERKGIEKEKGKEREREGPLVDSETPIRTSNSTAHLSPAKEEKKNNKIIN